MNEKFCILIRISLKFVYKGPIDNDSALVQVIALWRTGDKPLPESMLTQFTDAYMPHYWKTYLMIYCVTKTKTEYVWKQMPKNVDTHWATSTVNWRWYENRFTDS